jgi:hypothetical protein
MIRKLWKDVWATVGDIPENWSETTEGTIETGKAVLDLAKALEENKTAKELAPLVGQFSSLLDVLNSPLVQVAGSALPFVSIGAGVLKFYLQATRREPTLELGVAVVSQAAYMESLQVFLNTPENSFLNQYVNKPASKAIAKQIKALGEGLQQNGTSFELDKREAENALICFHQSKLAVMFNQVLEARLRDGGMPDGLAATTTERVAWGTHRYMKEAIASAGEAAMVLAKVYGDRGVRDLEVYRSLDDYQEKVIGQKPKEKVFNEEFGFEDIYVPMRVKGVNEAGEVRQGEESESIEDWAIGVLQDPTQNKRVMFVQGGPGRGKSVFCRMFGDRVRREFYPIWTPILIRLRDISGDGFSVDFDKTLEVAVGTDFSKEKNWLTDRDTRFLFLLDGFDELLLERGASQELKEFLEQVSLFQARCGELGERGHRVLITGRPMALYGIERQMPNNLARVEIVPMADAVQEQWLGRWGRIKDEDAARALEGFIRAENCPQQVRELAREPLLLYLLAAMHGKGRLRVEMFGQRDAVGVRIEIYEAALEMVLEEQRRDDRQGNLNDLLTGFEAEDLRSILSEAGLCVVQSGGECAAIAMIEERLKLRDDGAARELLEVAKGRDDVLKNALAVFYLKSNAEAERHDPKVEFFHKSFGEFLCADRLCETLGLWTEMKGEGRRQGYRVSQTDMQRQVYDLLGFGALTAEIVEYLMALLKRQEPKEPKENGRDYWVRLADRLKEFYWDWSGGRWIEAIDDEGEPLPLRQARWFRKRNIKLGQREVDIYTGLNVMILLFQLHHYAQSREDLKECLSFHPCGQPDTEEFDRGRLLRMISYSGSLIVPSSRGILCGFLRSADLNDADLSGANLSDADLSDAYLSSAYLISANLSGADLSNAYLSSAYLISAYLSGADLSDANLSSAYLISAYLSSADLSGANLSSAYLISANLSGANLSGANLSSANLSGANLRSIEWNDETQWANAIGLYEATAVPKALQQTPQFAASLTLSQGIDWVKQGRVEEALEAYQQAQQIDASLGISADSWRFLCWYGCLHGFAEQVLFAGENAVNLDPGNKDCRGLARALTWDYPGALIDFEEFLESDEFQYEYLEDERERRRRWVEVLRQGRNPFTEEELQELRDRYLRS